VLPWPSEAAAEELTKEANVAVSIAPQSRWVMHLWFNQAARGQTDPVAHPHPVLSDPRVRRAIRMAINVDPIAEQIYLGYSTPVWTEFFRMPDKCGIARPAFDPAQAEALLTEVGWQDTDGDGVRECRGCATAQEGDLLRLELIAYSEAGEALQLAQQLMAEDLKKVGIDVTLSTVEGAVLWATTADGGIEPSGNWDMTLWDTGYAGQDPTPYLRDRYHSAAAIPDQGTNYGRFLNSRFDALLDEAVTVDKERQLAVFCEMARILEEEVPNVSLYSTLGADAYSTRLQGIESNINDLVTWNVADWTLK
jgi:peptide/nickel transport system substrate-binding protein